MLLEKRGWFEGESESEMGERELSVDGDLLATAEYGLLDIS